MWTIAAPQGGSGNVPSDFVFDADEDAFYNPHAPRLLDDGQTLVVMDDGTDRPGCKQTVSDVGNTVVIGCFSRAVAYTLDFTTYTATLKWQFAFPLNEKSELVTEKSVDIYNNDGGAAAPLENGNFIVEFGKIVHSGNDVESGINTRVFEVNATSYVEGPSADMIQASMEMPRAYWVDGQYRSLPRSSIAGESAVPPFAISRR